LTIDMKGNSNNRQVTQRLDILESNLFHLASALLTGGFIVVGGLLTIIAALLGLIAALLLFGG
jgi:hypothetical protein